MFGGAATSLFTSDEKGIVGISLRLERNTLRPYLALELEHKFKNKIEATFLRRSLDQNGQINTETTATYVKNFNKNDVGVCRYVFVVLKRAAADTATTNYKLCAHANLHNL